MKKYLILFQIAWKRTLLSRGANILYLSIAFLNFFVSIGVWSVAYKNPNFRSQESFSTFISYFLITMLMSRIVFSWIFDEISGREIKLGELSVSLLKPIPYFPLQLIQELPWRLQQFVMTLPIVLVLYFIYSTQIFINPLMLMLAILIGIFGYFLSFIINIFFSSFTFWTDDNVGLGALWEITSLLFTGIGMPIFFFPPLLQTISKFLPFQYILYFPVTVALGRLSNGEIILNFAYLLTWIGILGIVTKYLWNNGLKKFSGEGR